MNKRVLWVAVCAVALAGCSHDAREEYRAAGSSATDAVEQTGQAIKTDATEAGSSMRSESARAQVISKNDATSARVKSALMAAANMPTSKLRVDTNGHVVTLTGTVPTADQKHRAAVITKQELGAGFDVENHLTVSAS